MRLVTDDEQADEAVVQSLVRAGLAVKDDARPTLMHHKFIVIDGSEVWTGSMNLTTGSVFHDDNNLLRLRSAELAADFSGEFEEMFREGRFGALSEPDTPFPQVDLDDVAVEVLFSPDDGVARRLVQLIGEGRREHHHPGVRLHLGSTGGGLAGVDRSGGYVCAE